MKQCETQMWCPNIALRCDVSNPCPFNSLSRRRGADVSEVQIFCILKHLSLDNTKVDDCRFSF
jgi:hypothetical protein